MNLNDALKGIDHEKEKLINAAHLLKNYCQNNPYCKDCIFDLNNDYCIIGTGGEMPKNWYLEEL